MKYVAGFQQSMFVVAAYAVGETALRQSMSSHLTALNTPGAPPVDSGCETALGSLYNFVERQRPRPSTRA